MSEAKATVRAEMGANWRYVWRVVLPSGELLRNARGQIRGFASIEAARKAAAAVTL